MKKIKFNIPITKHLKINIWFFPMLFSAIIGGYADIFSIAYAVAFFHEISHVFCAHVLNVPVSNIIIYPFGMCAELSDEYIKNSEKEFLIAFSGPLFNIILALFCLVLNDFFKHSLLIYCIDINIAMCIINILPSLPLDGGRMLKSILTIRYGILRSYNFMLKISKLIIFFLVFTAIFLLVVSRFNFSLILISAFLMQNICSEQKTITLITLKEILCSKDNPQIISNTPTKLLSATKNIPARSLLSKLSYDYFYVINIIDESGKIIKTITETEVVSKLVSDGTRIKYGDI